eukprot:scaffold25545_cov78-Skeletonema_dohrnii-CCMP3373.AAC.4
MTNHPPQSETDGGATLNGDGGICGVFILCRMKKGMPDCKENTAVLRLGHSNPDSTNTIIAAQLNSPWLVQCLGEHILRRCVYIWSKREFDLSKFFISSEIHKEYAWSTMLNDLTLFILHYGKRTAASLLRRKQFLKLKEVLGKSQATTKLAVDWALDIVCNISVGVRDFDVHEGDNLAHCCMQNARLEFVDKVELSCLLAYTLHDNLDAMKKLTIIKPEEEEAQTTNKGSQ